MLILTKLTNLMIIDTLEIGIVLIVFVWILHEGQSASDAKDHRMQRLVTALQKSLLQDGGKIGKMVIGNVLNQIVEHIILQKEGNVLDAEHLEMTILQIEKETMEVGIPILAHHITVRDLHQDLLPVVVEVIILQQTEIVGQVLNIQDIDIVK